MNKLITPIFVIAIIVAGIGVAFAQPLGRCGDGICDDFEKAHPDLCPKDCQGPVAPLPSISEDSPFGIHDPTVPNIDRIEDVAVIRAKWVRYAGKNGIVWDIIEPQKGTFDWAYYDQLYLGTFKNNIKMFVSILPANRWDRYIDPRQPEQMPKDIEAYKNFLRKAVERYDGDGIDDAPGSPVISVWQISNEADLFWKGTPADYAKFLKESYKIIKEANPKALVAIAGVASPLGFAGTKKFYLPLLEELSRIRDNPQDRYFDIFDFHWYPFMFESQYNYLVEHAFGAKVGFYLDAYINDIKQRLSGYGYDNIPIFITETAQYSGKPNPPPWADPQIGGPGFRSEKNQALDLFKIYVYSLAKGVKKIFWVTLTEWHNFGGGPNGVFDNVGLINNPQNDGQSHKKLAYYTYRKMVDILEGSDWNNIQTVQEKDGICIYKFIKNGKPIWVAWNDNPGEKEIMISGIFAKQVKITEAMPKYESGKEVKDYNAAFKTYTKVVMDGKVNINLGELPVFVEGME